MPSSPHNPVVSSLPQGPGLPLRPFKPSPSSDSDWLPNLIFSAKAIAAGAESLPIPYVKGAFGAAVLLLESVEKVQKNREDMKELCEDIMDIITVVQNQVSSHKDTAALQFKAQCEGLEDFLQDVVKTIQQRQIKPRGFSARFREVVKLGSTRAEITKFRNRIQEVRANFMLMATVDTSFQVQKVLTVISPSVLVSQVHQPANNCPPPTRIFHGRRSILDKMHQYFIWDMKKQYIFLLHGLGGAGKTQIALKFVEEATSHFTDIFLVDTSTMETIDASLKSIAVMKSVGDSSRDALQWLSGKKDDWLLFFDNADDPKINLNNYFPQCSHGNILITSRNPGLRVYAGAHCAVSDMEETDAVALLLRSSAEDTTDHNQETAAQIVKTLYYLPLAIIQAGAFIAKSGDLDSYLVLYTHNKARLLTERPAQAHDNYAWTVYTTWQISFEQLSQQAKIFLQLCSFLHYQGISEEIFRSATNYRLETSGPSKEELEMPFKVLSQFLGSSGIWDPLCFIDVTNELKAYSLINFDSKTNMLSIHPLVHEWTRDILSDEVYHHCNFNESPDFRLEYGKVYFFAGKLEKAEELQVMVLEKRRNLLGNDNLMTLEAMSWLAYTYDKLGKWKEAEELGVVVHENRRDILGDNHADTLEALGHLALVYYRQAKFEEAEKLWVITLNKRRDILGDSHLDTLEAMESLASLYNAVGNFKEAEELGVMSLAKRSNILGDNHPDTLISMGNLSYTYQSLGKLQEAQVLDSTVFERRRNILGDNHPETLTAMGNLAFIYIALDRLQDAEELGLIVLEKRKNVLGYNHPDTLLAMGNLALTYNKLGRLREAEELQVLVLEKWRNTLGDKHLATLRAMANLGSTFNKLERWQEAEELLVVALEEQGKIFMDRHPHIVDTMQSLSLTFTKLGKIKEAEDLKTALQRS
ncbi:hypothetical protein FB451DRAFT_1375538 [Mycena latifolia]|nr:hypothetical protein FB451DRAFT_1375538 [Mycena latifolia]